MLGGWVISGWGGRVRYFWAGVGMASLMLLHLAVLAVKRCCCARASNVDTDKRDLYSPIDDVGGGAVN